MQIRFAASQPAGDHVLVLPATGPSIAAATGIDPIALVAILKRQRFEGDAGSVVEHFMDGEDAPRMLIVGLGRGDAAAAEQLGGAVVARLLTSGEREAVIDLSSATLDADSAARVALAAVLRSWRNDA
jgi:leucyl aminopeptidase